MRQQAKDSWLAARNPTVKIVMLLSISLIVLFLFDPVPLLALYLLAVPAVRYAARIPWRMLVPAQSPFVLFGVGILMVNALTRPGTQALDVPIRITEEGITIGSALALRALVIGLGAIAFIATTPPREMMVSAMQHARVPPRFAYALLAGGRSLEAMPRTWTTIRAAQAVRAPLGRSGRPKAGAGAFARASFALLVDSIRSSERIALALESRGLGDRPRTVWRPVPLGRRDAVLVVATLAPIAVVLVVWLLVLPPR